MPPRQQSLISSLTSVIETVWDFAKDPQHSKWLAVFLLTVDAVLCALIIKTVDYTEIDWTAYMQQVEKYVQGERDYGKIEGDTGPLVYPAVHVYIYRALYAMTNGGTNILLAQCYFAVLYLANLALVMACYRMAKAPPYIFPMLILSKRLHSIYMLRCFNDCWAVGALFLAIFLFQQRHWTYGALIFSAGIGIKMSLLVALPAVLVLLYQAKGPAGAATIVMYMAQVQFFSSFPFTSVNARAYISRAFQLTRVFKHEWTVNWRFVPESTFLSREFSIGLLVAHASLLALFALTRWTRPLGRTTRDLARLAFANPSAARQRAMVRTLNADFILTTVLTSVIIGMLCARSLHYQFFAYIAWATPFLLWKAKLHPALQVVIWGGQEAAWNVYPSADMTSKIVVGTLAALVVNLWTATGEDVPTTIDEMAERVVVERAGKDGLIARGLNDVAEEVEEVEEVEEEEEKRQVNGTGRSRKRVGFADEQ